MMLIDLIIEVLLFTIFWRYGYAEDIYYYFWGNVVVILMMLIEIEAFKLINGGYRLAEKERDEILFIHILSTLICLPLIYLELSLIDYHFLKLQPLILLACAQLLWAFIFSRFADYQFLTHYGSIKLIYVGEANDEILKEFNQRSSRFQIIGCYDAESIDAQRLASADGLLAEQLSETQRRRLNRLCYEQGKDWYEHPPLAGLMLMNGEMMCVGDLMLNHQKGLKNDRYKRCFDIVISLLLLIVMFPIMLITAVLIKLEDGGAIFYKQERYSLDEKIISILKFRSMREDAEADGVARLCSTNDQRLTKTGKFIRRCRIDELPQLINVLKGEMSLVGPRPERPVIAEQLKQQLPEFAYRTKVKAGLTGYAQVMGKYSTSMEYKLRFDLVYIQHQSMMLDLLILTKTVCAVFEPNRSK